MKTSLIVGMGIGELYASVLSNLGHGVITVDSNPDKKADFLTVEDAIKECRLFDTVHICTPNFTHEVIARTVAPYTRIVFIEKPGVIDSKCWQCLTEDFPKTRFMMVKNNMWRDNIEEMKALAKKASFISIQWCNKDRVPNPGTWFTTKELAYGGVSRDLMPHLLSLYVALDPNWRTGRVSSKNVLQLWELKDLLRTDYGVVNPNGTYDVDDHCRIEYEHKVELIAQWRTEVFEARHVKFMIPNSKPTTIELGLCPENAYQAMIKEAVERIDDNDFWNTQYEIDFWIHQQIEDI